jgi:hypothetical protein
MCFRTKKQKFSESDLTISGLLGSSVLVGVGTAESDLGLILFGFGLTDEKIF